MDLLLKSAYLYWQLILGILAVNNISLNTYFKTIQPLEFTDLDNVVDEETKEEETGVKMCSLTDCLLLITNMA